MVVYIVMISIVFVYFFVLFEFLWMLNILSTYFVFMYSRLRPCAPGQAVRIKSITISMQFCAIMNDNQIYFMISREETSN